MAYGATISTQNLLGGRWLIRVAELEAQNSSTKVITLTDPNGDGLQDPIPFSQFELVQCETIKVSGDGATVQTKLQRYLADGTTLRTMFDAPSAVAEMAYLFNPPLRMYTNKLKHASRVASGTNNVIWTEYTIQEITGE